MAQHLPSAQAGERLAFKSGEDALLELCRYLCRRVVTSYVSDATVGVDEQGEGAESVVATG